MERAMGIEPIGKPLPSLWNRRFDANAKAKCDQRVNFGGMWGHVGQSGDTRRAKSRLEPLLS
jgi:hypothetical protein